MGTGLAKRLADMLGEAHAEHALTFFHQAKTQLRRISRVSRQSIAAGPQRLPVVQRFRHQPYNDLMADPYLAQRPKEVEERFIGWERAEVRLNRYETLKRLVDELPLPNLANLALVFEEVAQRKEDVYSLPADMAMDLSSICNVQCRFCKYTHHHVPKAFLPIEHIKQIEWFKYLSYLNFSAGTAESIIHPQFSQIFSYVRDTFPHLRLTILTNGRSLVEQRLEEFRERLDYLYVSMNASSREDYDHVIYKGDWDKFSANMKAMGRVLNGAKRPFIQGNFVMMRSNIDRAVANLEFAAASGAHLVTFCHFYPHYIPDLHAGNEDLLSHKFSFQDSLYFEKEKSDEVFARVTERARELGVEVRVPVPFGKPSQIHFANRSDGAIPDDCYEPWHHLFLLWGWKSRREEATICCGLASDIGAFFDRDEIKSVAGLRAFWNSPVLRAYRRSVNGTNLNPICDMCRKVDRFDPAGHYPDQRDFFKFAGLPVPEHLRRGQASGSI